MRILSLLTQICLLVAVAARLEHSFPDPEFTAGNTVVHDPTMCKDHAGKYWLFSSDAGIEIRTSHDRVTWILIGTVWPKGAPWTDQYSGRTNGPLWAPACKHADGKFILYYASSTSGSRNSAIFLATSRTGMPGGWEHKGLVISTSDADDYNAIDPNLLIDTDGKWWLSFGSYWSGIKVIRLDHSTGHRHDHEIHTVATRTEDRGAIEGSNIYKYDTHYFLFTSWGRACCNLESKYEIRVGRALKPTGPYHDKAGKPLLDGGGTLVLGPHGSIHGPGGQDQLTDRGARILLYHFWNSTTGHFVGINHLDFSSGWPVAVRCPVDHPRHFSASKICRHKGYDVGPYSNVHREEI